MPSTVTCPSCNVALKPKTPVPAGTRIKCPKCQTVFVVPGDEEVAPAAPAPKPAAPRPAAAKPPAPKPKPAPQPVEEEEEVVEAADGGDDAAAAAEAPGGGGFKGKLKKVPMWGWIAGGVGALILLCGCCPFGGWLAWVSMSGGGGLLGGGNVNMATYNKLKKGMSEDEVKTVMGGAPSLQNDLGGIHSETWKGSGDDFITVGFQKDKSLSGAYQFTNGAAKLSGGGALP